jgi:hypothetical protein
MSEMPPEQSPFPPEFVAGARELFPDFPELLSAIDHGLVSEVGPMIKWVLDNLGERQEQQQQGELGGLDTLYAEMNDYQAISDLYERWREMYEPRSEGE